MRRNAFEALCSLASEENWCWNLYCTTCWHMYFRYAFLELLKGHHPNDENWVTRKRNHRRLDNELGSVFRLGVLSLEEMDEIQKICAGADLKAIAASCRFPDWLGYLGLVLGHFGRIEHANNRLTLAWAPQLADMLPEGSPFRASIGGKAEGSWPLHVEDMERVEREIGKKRWQCREED